MEGCAIVKTSPEFDIQILRCAQDDNIVSSVILNEVKDLYICFGLCWFSRAAAVQFQDIGNRKFQDIGKGLCQDIGKTSW